ncbi:MAG TPA: glutamate--tRNA ligase [Candidatus Nanoarchaeia archaeon]|nr:glutamate--tRNA ligase [Candidatus Nanoarchaeia archaeon]
MDLIRKYVLQNSIKFSGKASAGAVIGKIIAEKPELKEKIKEIAAQVNKEIKEVAKIPLKEQEEELKRVAPELLEEKKQESKRVLPELKDPKNLVMRFEPSPSGPLHIGHAYVLSLNSEYCRKYNGKLILRISDTNPGNICDPAYEMIPKDAQWVTKSNVKEVHIQSDRLATYYNYMEQLINLGKAYVCTCEPEGYKKLLHESIACPCRELPVEVQMKRWKRMFDEYKQGEAVVRIKTDLNHKNPAMRDFPVFRISELEHARQDKRYRVWPLMNMAVSVDDIEMKVTHAIRAKDHYDNAERQKYIYSYLNKKFPQTLFVGRINFEGMPVSCSKTRPLIEDGTYIGWDDIKLPFLAALKRRGYQPGAFIKYAIDVGLSLNDKTVTRDEFFKTINAFNKDIIDPVSNRYFFIWNPVEITIEKAPSHEVELDLHPDHKKGGRKFSTRSSFYITGEDFKAIKGGKLYRLMDCLNFQKKGSKFIFDSLDYQQFKEKGDRIIHWLPKEKLPEVEVFMPDGVIHKGIGEKALTDMKVGDICQLERLGFCRLDKKEKKLSFWYAHK